MGVDPVTAGLVLAGASLGSSVLGARSANRTAANATNAQTRLSAGQFNTRNQLAKDVFGENLALSRDAWAALNALDDNEFAARTGLTKEAFNTLNEIEKAQIVRDAAAADENLAGLTADRLAAQGVRGAARAEYDQELADANRRQGDFRSRADEVTRALIAGFSQPAQGARVADATAQRAALQRYSGSASPNAYPTNRATAQTKMAFQRESDLGRAFAADQGARGAGLDAVFDALGAGNREIDNRNADVAFIQDAATRALIPAGARMDAASLRFNNAADARAASGANRAADLDAAINVSAQRAAGAARPVQAYSTAMDDAMAAFYGNRRAGVGGAAEGRIAANNALLGGANSASGAFEGNMRGLTDYRIRAGQNNGWTMASQFAGQLAPVFMDMPRRPSVAAPGAAPNFTYGRVPGLPVGGR